MRFAQKYIKSITKSNKSFLTGKVNTQEYGVNFRQKI